MTETDLRIALIILVLVAISLIDFIIVTGSVLVASKIFRYDKKDRKTASRIALYSLKVGLIVAAPFALALYVTNPSIEEILAKGPRLLLPLGLVFLVKTSAIFLEMNKVYGEGMKKTVNGYATAAYLIICSWILFIVIFFMFVGFYGTLSFMAAENGDTPFTGWWDLSPDLPGNYSASTSAYSLLFRNARGGPIEVNYALVGDVISEDECNVSSPSFPVQLEENGTFLLKARCPFVNLSAGDPFGLILEINYTTLNDPSASLIESDYISGNASA